MSRRLRTAIEAVLDIAWHGGDVPVSSAAITNRQGIPRRYLEPLLQKLVHAGILTGRRGPRGGYLLARERHRISLGDIYRVVETSEEGGPFGAGEETVSELAKVALVPVWQDIEAAITTRLDETTIHDLVELLRGQGMVSDAALRFDFTI